MILRYRKKPIIIEACQWVGKNFKELDEFTGGNKIRHIVNDRSILIPTLEGDHIASLGDYIVRVVEGEFYPCKPGIFEKIYELDCEQ